MKALEDQEEHVGYSVFEKFKCFVSQYLMKYNKMDFRCLTRSYGDGHVEGFFLVEDMDSLVLSQGSFQFSYD